MSSKTQDVWRVAGLIRKIGCIRWTGYAWGVKTREVEDSRQRIAGQGASGKQRGRAQGNTTMLSRS
jgi:hypothetical protein